MSRYFSRMIVNNDQEQHKELFDKRGVREITQFATPRFESLEQEELDSINCYRHVWKYGDLFWKLSTKYYGNPKYWWVIASFNRKPTEGHIKLGEVMKIPVSLAEALQAVE